LGTVAGSRDGTLTIENASGNARFRCLISNGCGGVETTPAVLTVDGDSRCQYDFNQDENVDLTDAQQMARVVVGLVVREAAWLDGDLNADGNADLLDAEILAQFVVVGVCGI
jgi:hypothetical protein